MQNTTTKQETKATPDAEVIRIRARLFVLHNTDSEEKQQLEARLRAIDKMPYCKNNTEN